MKKDGTRVAIVSLIVFALYNLIVFVIPFSHTESFWLSYAFTLVAFAVMVASIYIAFIKNPDAKSRFYGFSVARVGVIYFGAQLAVSLFVMILADVFGWKLPLLVYAIGLGAALVGLVSTEAVVTHIKTLENTQKAETARIRILHGKASQLAALSGNAAVKALAEELRYSDPVSNSACTEAENNLASAISAMEIALQQGDTAMLEQQCSRATTYLADRNRMCKLFKK